MVVGFLLNLKFGLVVAAGVAVVVAALLASDGLHRPQETPGANWRTSDFREPHDPWTRDRPNRSRSSSNSVRRRRRQAGEDSQKTIMTDELCAGIADCSICVERIERYDEVYSCKSCYNIFHLRCIRKWANTCLADHGRQWSCPVCKLGNNVQPQLLVYTCMCGQTVRPTPVLKVPRATPPRAPTPAMEISTPPLSTFQSTPVHSSVEALKNGEATLTMNAETVVSVVNIDNTVSLSVGALKNGENIITMEAGSSSPVVATSRLVGANMNVPTKPRTSVADCSVPYVEAPAEQGNAVAKPLSTLKKQPVVKYEPNF